MYAAVIKLDALTDTVGTSAEDHDLWSVAVYRMPVRSVVGRIVVSAVLRSADMNALPCLLHAQRDAALTDLILGNRKDLT